MIDRLQRAAAVLEREVDLPLYALLLLVLVIVVMTIVIWSLKRRRDPHFSYKVDGDFDQILPSLTGMTFGDLVEGNSVRILQNGGFFPPLLEDLANAKETINFEAYLWKKGEIAQQIADLLARKSRHGVEVRLLVDANGGSGLGYEVRRQLKKAGCRVEKYHPWRLGNLGSINNRDHRKIVVIDGRAAYIGGHCIVDSWMGNAEDKEHFRDISVRVEGPIVHRIQSCFTENWVEECGEVLAGQHFFPKLEPAGNVAMHLAFTTAAGSTSALELLHYIAIHAAKQQITIQNPYFLPDPGMIDALINASERGVKVRVMLPAAEASDHSLVQHASHHHFGSFLKKGIRIFEYQKTLLHQKVMTVDHVWSLVGSTNIDDRSFELNDEVSLGIYNRDVAAVFEGIFDADLKNSVERRFGEWSKRGMIHKLTDGSAYLINEQL